AVNPELLRRFAQASPRALEELRLALAQEDRGKTRSALYRLRTQAAALGAAEGARFAPAAADGVGRVATAPVAQSLATAAGGRCARGRGARPAPPSPGRRARPPRQRGRPATPPRRATRPGRPRLIPTWSSRFSRKPRSDSKVSAGNCCASSPRRTISTSFAR